MGWKPSSSSNQVKNLPTQVLKQLPADFGSLLDLKDTSTTNGGFPPWIEDWCISPLRPSTVTNTSYELCITKLYLLLRLLHSEKHVMQQKLWEMLKARASFLVLYVLLENTSIILADLSSTLHEAWSSFDGSFRFSHCCTCTSRTNSPVTATLLPQHWAHHVQLAGLSQLYFRTLLQTDGDIQQYHLAQSWASRSLTVRHGSKLKLYTWSPQIFIKLLKKFKDQMCPNL